MSKASPIITAMNAGEWGADLEGRVDIDGYSASAKEYLNALPTIPGPFVRRAGTGFVRQVKDTSDVTRLVPFTYSQNDALMLEFGDQYVRFYQNRAAVLTGSAVTITGATQADPVVITAAAHGYSNGQDVFISGVSGMTEINGRWFRVANQTTNTFELTTIHGDDVDGTGYTAYTSGGYADIPYEISSPYTAADLTNSKGELGIDFVQVDNTLYITDRSGAIVPRKLVRSSATSWAFDTLAPRDGPFDTLNGDSSLTVYTSAATGSVTITASSSVFTADDVGRLIRIDQEEISTGNWETNKSYAATDYARSNGKEYYTALGGTSGTVPPDHTAGTVRDGRPGSGVEWTYTSAGYGVAVVTAYTSGTSITATVLTRFPQTVVGAAGASSFWRFSPYSADADYPSAIAFWRDRLIFATGSRIDMSVSGQYESFAPDNFGEILPESAVSLVLPGSASQVAAMQGGDALFALTEGGEVVVGEQNSSDVFGPNNVRSSVQTGYGARPIQAVRVGDAILFVQSSGKRLRAMGYSIERDSFVAPDQNLRAPHIAVDGISRIADRS